MSVKTLFFPICIIASLAIFIWLAKPAYDEAGIEKQELEKKEATLEILEEKKSSFQKIVTEYNNLGDESTLVFNLLPENIKTDDFIAEISDKAKEAGIALSKIKINEKATVGVLSSEIDMMGAAGVGVEGESVINMVSVEAVEVEAGSFGSYDGFKRFINLTEGMNRYVDLVKVQIKKVEVEEAEAGHDLVEANMKLVIYKLANDDKVNITNKVFANDPIIASLSSGSFNKQALKQSKEYVTSSFQFVPSEDGLGKENIFFW